MVYVSNLCNKLLMASNKFDVMKCNCKYNKEKDLGIVAEGLAIDLQKAIDHGIVLDSSINLDVNGVEEPGDIWCRVNDVFEAIDRERDISAFRSKIKLQADKDAATKAAQTSTVDTVS